MEEEKGRGFRKGAVSEYFLDVVDIIGAEKSLELCDKLGGQYVYVPLLTSFRRKQRNESIWRQKKAGMPTREIALQWKMHPSAIRKIIAKKRKEKQKGGSKNEDSSMDSR